MQPLSSHRVDKRSVMMIEMKHMFEPIKIGKVTLKNRLIVSPMVVNYCTTDGYATETYIAYHEARAKGGWGLIITEDYAVDPAGKAFVGIAGLWEDGQIPGHAELTARVHAHGAAIFAQIYHAGRQSTQAVTGTDSVAPTAIPCPFTLQMPHELTVDEIERIVEQFGDCALRAKKAGFDGVEVHGGHGYLIAQFMSSYSNKRFDKYGGNLVSRMRLPLEIIADIRKKCGDEFPVQFRISADEMVPGGRTIEDSKAQLWMLEQAGIDSFDISVGTDGSHHVMVAAPAAGHGWMTDHAAAIKAIVNKPVFTVGRINDPLVAESLLASGKADGIVMGRASLADPEFPNKAREGRFEDIIQCTGCMQGCETRVISQLPVRCTMNPRTGRENEFAITPAAQTKKVFVAGGGPAGMEAAIVAAQRGHDVTLFEKGNRLGGQYYLASVPPWKGEISAFLAWQRHTLEKLGVTVLMNTPLTAETVEDGRPDAVIVATGSVPAHIKISGLDQPFVTTAQDVLEGKASLGEKVAVIGGGMIGCETANHLAHHGRKPTIIEMLCELAGEEPVAIKRILFQSLKENEVPIYCNSTVTGIREDGSVEIVQGGEQKALGPFETVVLAGGMQPVNNLVAELEGIVGNLQSVGDANSVRTVLEALEEGYEAGLEV
jgi:2,4-dienoyl-CoA reductase-like NADH-dependent reductase (Old Yellow Enzyme family)/thioredoxin reductase